MRKALRRFYPRLDEMELIDYKVRVLSGEHGTGYQNAVFQPLPRASIPLSFVMSAGLVQVEELLPHSQERFISRP